MTFLAFQSAGIEYSQWGIAGAIIFLVIAFLAFVLKISPIWKDVRFKEIDVRSKEAETAGQIASALVQSANAQTHLGTALGQLGTTIRDIAIEQRKATENVMILQRVNADESENIHVTVNHLIERIGTLEENFGSQGFYETRPKAIKKV